MLCLAARLSNLTNTAAGKLVCTLGEHLLQRFTQMYHQFFCGHHLGKFLPHLENCIHIEVRKLFPDAELPHFQCGRTEEGHCE